MKIWIDARVPEWHELYKQFVEELSHRFVQANPEHTIIVYTEENLPYKKWHLLDERKTKKVFEGEDFQLMLFFDHHIPRGYKGESYIILESLKEVFFPKKKLFHRKVFAQWLAHALRRAKLAISLDPYTANEINEKLDIPEWDIRVIPGFFSKYQQSPSHITLDIKAKHNLRGDYLIYDSGNELHNNFDRILKTLKKLKDKNIILYLLILCDETNQDIDIRNKVIEYGIADQILFLWEVDREKEASYYSQSVGVIFSSMYESFPFHFYKALAYNKPIFANDIPVNVDTLGEQGIFLNSLSIHAVLDRVESQLNSPRIPDYSEILTQYSPEKTAQRLSEIIFEKV